MAWAERLEQWRRRPFIAFSVAVGSVALAAATRIGLDPLVGDRVPFLTFVPAVLVTSLLAGFWPGMAAAVLSGVAAWYAFLAPRLGFSTESLDLSVLTVFLGAAAVMASVAALVSVMVERVLQQGRTLLALRQHESEMQQLLIRELEHRTRNLFGLVHTLAARSLAHASSLAEAREAFLGRLAALAAAYSLTEKGEGASLSTTLQHLLRLHAGRIQIQGCDIRLTDSALQQLTLIVHELHTNAMKYGALSTEAGRISISGNIEQDGDEPRFRFVWREADGPVVRQPARSGFGQTILRRAPEYGGATVSIDYEPGGLRYTYVNALGAISPDGRRAPEPSVHP
ncbi:MAG: DUF4118 domain-containing protein [Pseudomonadota bacterium]